jgi:hypothetical protein
MNHESSYEPSYQLDLLVTRLAQNFHQELN